MDKDGNEGKPRMDKYPFYKNKKFGDEQISNKMN